MTFLHVGIQEGWPQVVQVALKRGLSMNDEDMHGHSSWHYLFREEHLTIEREKSGLAHPCAHVIQG